MRTRISNARTGEPALPTDGVLRLAAELEWLVEGDEVDEIARAIPAEFCRRYGQSLVLRFGNSVGRLLAGPLGTIEVYSGKLGAADFDAMLADITQRMTLLPFDVHGRAQLPYDRSITSNHQVLYHAFAYLRHVLSPNAAADEQLLPALRTIVAEPHRALQRSQQWSPLDRVRRVEPHALLSLLDRNAQLSSSPSANTTALGRALRGHLPAQIQERRVESTLDVPENRFVKALLEQIVGIVERMDELAGSHSSESFRRQIRAECAQMLRQLAPIRQHAMWPEVSTMQRLPGESQVLQRRRGYKQVFGHFLRLRLACQLPLHDVARMLEIRDIAELYELWSFFAVERALEQVLGRPPQTASLPHVDDFGARLGYGLRVAWSGGVELFYNLSHSQSQTNNRSYSLRLRPDVLLRLATGSGAIDHVFDAKFKLRRLSNSTGSDHDDSEADERRGVYLHADIYKMHTYRDALPSVRSAWTLYPGSEFRFFAVADGEVRDPAQLHGSVAGVGAVGLVPSHDDHQLRQVLARMLAPA